MSEVNITYRFVANAYDPTRTLTLRRAFVRSMDRRFRELIAVIRKTIVDQDCFGLTPGVYQAPLTPPPGRQVFNFPRTADKVRAFMRWLQQQEQKGLLELVQYNRIGEAGEQPWTNMYIRDSYKRGVMRARYELRKAGYTVPTLEASGGIEAVLGTPFHIDRVGLMYSRAFSELEGITTAMDTQISRILAQGLVDGDNPNLLARKLVATINGSGMGELGITDSLGRFIPAQRRAQTLARTEVIRAHHAANMVEYRNWGAEGVEIFAEWRTAGDDRVCTECAGYDGNRYTLEAAEHSIPVHPNCRCVALPISRSRLPEGAEVFDEFVRTV